MVFHKYIIEMHKSITNQLLQMHLIHSGWIQLIMKSSIQIMGLHERYAGRHRLE